MTYTAKDYNHLLGMEGFSDTLLKNHFTLYQGYVTNTTKLADNFAQMRKEGKGATPEFSELKRRFGWEFDGMRLHEYYFDNLGGKGGLDASTALSKKLTKTSAGMAPGKRSSRRRGPCGGSDGPRFTRTAQRAGSSTAGLTSITLATWPAAARS
jgi:superoxide dismutase, Fe-Mn family